MADNFETHHGQEQPEAGPSQKEKVEKRHGQLQKDIDFIESSINSGDHSPEEVSIMKLRLEEAKTAKDMVADQLKNFKPSPEIKANQSVTNSIKSLGKAIAEGKVSQTELFTKNKAMLITYAKANNVGTHWLKGNQQEFIRLIQKTLRAKGYKVGAHGYMNRATARFVKQEIANAAKTKSNEVKELRTAIRQISNQLTALKEANADPAQIAELEAQRQNLLKDLDSAVIARDQAAGEFRIY